MTTESLYVHIPFCDNICAYCDFAKQYYQTELVDQYLTALQGELDQRVSNKNMKTIYIGGGTPSSLNLAQVERLLAMLAPYAHAVEEYTFEANPESLSPAKIKILARHGVNRVSLGVQSFNDDLVKALGRIHDQAMVTQVVSDLKAQGITNINLDLMYGLENQTVADIQSDLDRFIRLDVPHLSYYALIIEEHTVIGARDYPQLDDETEGALTAMVNGFLALKGYDHYEVSNYARPGFESRHNLAYWHYDNYVGIGIGAVSKIDDRLISNNRNLTKYLAGADIQTIETLTLEDTMFNHLMMNFRLAQGIEIAEFNRRYGVDIFKTYPEAFAKHLNKTIFESAGHLTLSEVAYNNLNSILVDFL